MKGMFSAVTLVIGLFLLKMCESQEKVPCNDVKFKRGKLKYSGIDMWFSDINFITEYNWYDAACCCLQNKKFLYSPTTKTEISTFGQDVFDFTGRNLFRGVNDDVGFISGFSGFYKYNGTYQDLRGNVLSSELVADITGNNDESFENICLAIRTINGTNVGTYKTENCDSAHHSQFQCVDGDYKDKCHENVFGSDVSCGKELFANIQTQCPLTTVVTESPTITESPIKSESPTIPDDNSGCCNCCSWWSGFWNMF